MIKIDKATYVDMEGTLTYYDMEVLQISNQDLIIKLDKQMKELSKQRESAIRTLGKINNKLKNIETEK